MFSEYLARQFGKPTGWLGRTFLPRAWRRFNRVPNERAFARLDLRPDDRVLEVGFGGGFLLGKIDEAVAAGFVAGVDHSPEMVAACATRFARSIAGGKMDLRLGDADRIPFADATFTKAVSVNSIFYWPDPAGALAEVRRVLREDGRLVLVFTRRASLKSRSFSRHIRNLVEANDVTRMLATVGFRDVEERLHSDAHREFWCVTARR